MSLSMYQVTPYEIRKKTKYGTPQTLSKRRGNTPNRTPPIRSQFFTTVLRPWLKQQKQNKNNSHNKTLITETADLNERYFLSRAAYKTRLLLVHSVGRLYIVHK